MDVTFRGKKTFIDFICPSWKEICNEMDVTISNNISDKDRLVIADIAGEPFNTFDLGNHNENNNNMLYLAVGELSQSELDIDKSVVWKSLIEYLKQILDRSAYSWQLAQEIKRIHIKQLKEAEETGVVADSDNPMMEMLPAIWHGLLESTLKVEAWRSLGSDHQSVLKPWISKGFNRDITAWGVLSGIDTLHGAVVCSDNVWRPIALCEDVSDFFAPTTLLHRSLSASITCLAKIGLVVAPRKN